MGNQVKYEIMTEDKSAAINSLIVKHVTKYFSGFTIIKGIGFWDGVRENSQTIIIIAGKTERGLITYIAGEIKSIGKQAAVLIAETAVKAKMV